MDHRLNTARRQVRAQIVIHKLPRPIRIRQTQADNASSIDPMIK
jgi:hypothetical protein